MGSHVFAIGLSWIAYIIVRRVSQSERFKGNSDKILSLSGYSSGLMLLIFAVVIMIEAIQRFYNPVDIVYKEAILVAIIGLLVNIASAFILHHKHEHSDHNIRAAYFLFCAMHDPLFFRFSFRLGGTASRLAGVVLF